MMSIVRRKSLKSRTKIKIGRGLDQKIRTDKKCRRSKRNIQKKNKKDKNRSKVKTK